jgi:hypothetical protein
VTALEVASKKVDKCALAVVKIVAICVNRLLTQEECQVASAVGDE